MSYRNDRSNQRGPFGPRLDRPDESFEGGRRMGGQSNFAQRGLSHEERMHDDDSSSRFPGRDPRGGRTGYGQGRGYEGEGPGSRGYPPAESRGGESRGGPGAEGYYGSGGSYGYGGAFDHGDQSGAGRGNEYRAGGDPGRGNEEFYESTGGFGYDTSGYGRQGLGYPGHSEQRAGAPGGGVHQRGGRGYFTEDENRTASGRGYFNEDARQGFTQTAGYWQSGGDRVGAPQGAGPLRGSGYGSSDRHSDGRGHEGGGRGPARGRFYGRMPQGYTRSDERIREDVCDQLSHGHIDPSQISVRVENGVVMLEGAVGSRHDKYHVEEVVDGVLGVKEVENRLRVRRGDEQPNRQASGAQGGAESGVESSTGANKPRNNGNVGGPRS